MVTKDGGQKGSETAFLSHILLPVFWLPFFVGWEGLAE